MLFIAGLDVVALGAGVVLQAVASHATNVLLGVTFGIIVATPVLLIAGLVAVWRSYGTHQNCHASGRAALRAIVGGGI